MFCWVRLGPPPDRLPVDAALRDEVQSGMRLRLARAQVLNCKLERPLSLAQRRNAKPAEQPYVASGRAQVDWKFPSGTTPVGVGLHMIGTVDTTAAGFRTPPCYSAQLLGSREFTFSVAGKTVKRMLDGFVMILAPSGPRQVADGSGLRLLAPRPRLAVHQSARDAFGLPIRARRQTSKTS